LTALAPPRPLPGGAVAYPLGDGTLIAVEDVALVTLPPPPPGIGASERWIDVDRGRQILVAREGARPVYATLISSAKNTPLGVHVIGEKFAHMALESDGKYSPDKAYRYDAPWVMDLGNRYALHSAYWHDRFGRHHGNGCVNLAPIDARWVFDWTEPALAPGWTSAVAVEGAPGTRVRVRDGTSDDD
jgi:lipoprotein-anchoring transpeptidase ErfK/SrfK